MADEVEDPLPESNGTMPYMPAMGAYKSHRDEAERLKAERLADPAYESAKQMRDRLGLHNPEPVIDDGAPPTQEEMEAAWNRAARAAERERRHTPNEEPLLDDPIRGLIQLQAARVANGWDFIHSVAEDVESMWGQGDEVLWAKGEPCLLVGPSGVGKSTLTQQIMRAHLTGGEVLRYPVTKTQGKILYLAMDRPAQIARSMGRMFGDDWETRLKDQLVVWRGPLPFSLVKQPDALATMCDELRAATVFVDSLKDLAPKISDEEAGSQINAAFQIAIVAGVEVFGIHHNRKAQGENKKPNKLSDVYGSQMLVNGAGSVMLLWGDP